MKKLRILYVAYPLLPVSAESCGGAEQVLVALEGEMHRRGHQTSVAAAAGSRVAGELVPTVWPSYQPDCIDELNREHAVKILEFVQAREQVGRPFDLIHDHSGSWWRHAAEVNVPVLVTLHLPPSFYPPASFPAPSNVSFSCVSENQFSSFQKLLGTNACVVENGIELSHFHPGDRKDDFLLWMGRICQEKGPHIAIEVARRSHSQLILAGSVYPFTYHQDYFDREIAPHLGGALRLRGSPSAREKLQLLQSARAVLIPSLVDETSSLVAMEALSCGTPVIAFRRGALADLIQDGITGRLVESIEEMTEALAQIATIRPQAGRKWAEANCSMERTCDKYEQVYFEIVSRAMRSAQALAA
jgi:glycosyltransferase involved in cell wall biosynthesis